MKVRLIAFGEIEVEGERFNRDVVIDAGHVRRRGQGPSKALRGQYGHTPLSSAESIPWGGRRLVVGTGADGSLPIAPDVYTEAKRRRVEIDALPTREACRLLANVKRRDAYAVLHLTG
jgi:hypothetical protein